MPRPSFQFYPGDWRSNAKLRRCSEAARGAWVDIMCVLHDGDQYGVARYPLAELVRAAGVTMKLARELTDKGVLKGADSGDVTYVYKPHKGSPVTLLKADGPCWFSSRMVRDEHFRTIRAEGGKSGAEHGHKGAEHGARGGRPRSRTGDNNPPPDDDVRGDNKPPSNPPPSSSSSSSVSTVEDKSSTGAGGANVVPFPAGDKPEWWPQRDRYGRVLGDIQDKLLYQVGKAVLGNDAGGLITRLKKCAPYNRDYRAAVELLLRADDEKAEPKSWFIAALHNAEMDEPLEPKHLVYPDREYRA